MGLAGLTLRNPAGILADAASSWISDVFLHSAGEVAAYPGPGQEAL
jgi:hypothetical protein